MPLRWEFFNYLLKCGIRSWNALKRTKFWSIKEHKKRPWLRKSVHILKQSVTNFLTNISLILSDVSLKASCWNLFPFFNAKSLLIYSHRFYRKTEIASIFLFPIGFLDNRRVQTLHIYWRFPQAFHRFVRHHLKSWRREFKPRSESRFAFSNVSFVRLEVPHHFQSFLYFRFVLRQQWFP